VTGFLLDTNVISELIKPRPSPKVARWVDDTDESLLHLSVLTLGEIRKGISSLPSSSRRAALENWFANDLLARFSGRILPVDLPTAERWGELTGSATARRAPLPVIDGLLAATALEHDLTFVTRDTKHVAATGVAVFDPWGAG
jgi:predicted nucleic acid-binding protein